MNFQIYSASVTPLLQDGNIDHHGLKNIFELGARYGLNGIFVAGSMGEWSFLGSERRTELVAAAASVKGSLKLMAGIHDSDLESTLRNIDKYKSFDIDFYVLTLPPLDSLTCSPIDFIRQVAAHADKPLCYYHCPARNRIVFSPREFTEIISIPGICGIKNSANDIRVRKELIMLRKQYDFMLLEGCEWGVDEALICGCDGALCGMGALAARPLRMIANAVSDGDFALAIKYQQMLIQVFHGVYGLGLETVFVGQKYALQHLGVIETSYSLAQPESLLTAARKKEIESCLAEYQEFLLGGDKAYAIS